MEESNKIIVYSNGYRTPYNVGLVRSSNKPSEESRRGVISSFSLHSRLRLRRAILESSIPGAVCYGLTLTLPWRSVSVDDALDDYKAAWNRFGVYFRRAFPRSAAIFRHELQKRKMPHCHLIVYITTSELCDEIEHKIWFLWLRSLRGLKGGNLIAFKKHGIKLERLHDNLACIRYICDHSSKRKQAQLGYKGKHWGYIGRDNFQPADCIEHQFASDAERVLFHRQVSRLCRFSVPFDCVFGSRKSRRVKSVSVRFISRATVERIITYYSGAVKI